MFEEEEEEEEERDLGKFAGFVDFFRICSKFSETVMIYKESQKFKI